MVPEIYGKNTAEIKSFHNRFAALHTKSEPKSESKHAAAQGYIVSFDFIQDDKYKHRHEYNRRYNLSYHFVLPSFCDEGSIFSVALHQKFYTLHSISQRGNFGNIHYRQYFLPLKGKLVRDFKRAETKTIQQHNIDFLYRN